MLRDCQKKLIEDIKQSIRKGNRRIIACASTGFGKSVVLASITKSALEKRKRVVVVLPRRSLVYQLSRTFQRFDINHGVLMSKERPYFSAPCQIVSIDTYISRYERMGLLQADVLLIDELHIQFTEKKLKLFDQYPLVVGFTATAIAPKRRSLGLFYDDIVESISMKELIKQGYLVPLRYFAPTDFHSENIKLNSDGEYNDGALNKYIDARLKVASGKKALVGDIYDNWHRLARDRKTVIFCVTQSHARFIMNEFMSHGIKSEYLDCNTPDDDRQRVFEATLNGDNQIITNVGIVSLGVDIPNLSCVVLARPTNSIANYLQCVGRGTRTHESKKDCLIIDHCGIVAKLGFAEDDQYWSLDGKETPEERKQKQREDKKEPKEITCEDCGNVFKNRRVCPECGCEVITEDKPIPIYNPIKTYKEELKEIKTKPADKQRWYAQLLWYARAKRYKRGWCDYTFQSKFGHFPKKKNGIQPIPPERAVLNYIQYLNIKRSKRSKRA